MFAKPATLTLGISMHMQVIPTDVLYTHGHISSICFWVCYSLGRYTLLWMSSQEEDCPFTSPAAFWIISGEVLWKNGKALLYQARWGSCDAKKPHEMQVETQQATLKTPEKAENGSTDKPREKNQKIFPGSTWGFGNVCSDSGKLWKISGWKVKCRRTILQR